MKMWFLVSKNTFKNIFKSWLTYILISIYFALSIYLVIIKPWLKVLDNIYGGSEEDLQMPLMINLILSSTIFSYISSMGDNNISVFFLSRPINKKIYFCSRWITVLITCFFLSFIYICFWLIIHAMIYNHNFNPYGPLVDHLDIFDSRYHTSLQQIIVPSLLLTFLSSTIGLFFKYYKYGSLSIFLSCIIGFFPLFFWLIPKKNIHQFQDYTNWICLYFPSIVFSIFSVSAIIFVILSIKFMKIKI
jgi:hypothetical protein